MRSAGTRNLRPLSSVRRNNPSAAFNASATSASTCSADSPLDTTSSRGVSLMPILTSTCDLRVVLITLAEPRLAQSELLHPFGVPLLQPPEQCRDSRQITRTRH